LIVDRCVGSRVLTISSRAYDVRTMHLVEPIRLLFYTQLLAQAPSVLGHRVHLIPDMLAEVESVIGRSAHASRPRGGNRAHPGRHGPLRNDEGDNGHFAPDGLAESLRRIARSCCRSCV